MKIQWTLLSVLAFSLIPVANAHSAGVAVMPVHGVNLSDGQCDAIGVFFASAFARDARVAVLSPIETRPVRLQVQTARDAAERLGAYHYVELTAVQLGSKVTLTGVLYDKNGSEVYRAQATGEDLDSMDGTSAELARALLVRRPVAGSVDIASGAPHAAADVPVAEEKPRDPNASHNAYGFKGGLSMPIASGRSFSPMVGLGFDARLGPRDYFLEFAASISVPIEDEYSTSDSTRVMHAYMDLGGGFYLSSASSALYLGAGISPAIWNAETGSYSSGHADHTSATCAVYGQLGATFSRDSRARIFIEVRASQFLLSVGDEYASGSSNGTGTENYRPAMLSLLMGAGF